MPYVPWLHDKTQTYLIFSLGVLISDGLDMNRIQQVEGEDARHAAPWGASRKFLSAAL